MTTLALHTRTARTILDRLRAELAPIDAEIQRLGTARAAAEHDALADLEWIDTPTLRARPEGLADMSAGIDVHVIEHHE